MTKETIIKEDGRLLVYYRFTGDDAETRRRGDAEKGNCGRDDSTPPPSA